MKHGAIRQVSPTLIGIREDHKARYRWANMEIPKGRTIIDAGCGIGYGSWLMAQFHEIVAYDIDPEALLYAERHYPHPNIGYFELDLSKPQSLPQVDAATCFEMIEHSENPEVILRNLHSASLLLTSVPNEEVLPWTKQDNPEHVRHYTEDQFLELLETTGWTVEKMYGQRGKHDKVHKLLPDCRTIIAMASRP